MTVCLLWTVDGRSGTECRSVETQLDPLPIEPHSNGVDDFCYSRKTTAEAKDPPVSVTIPLFEDEESERDGGTCVSYNGCEELRKHEALVQNAQYLNTCTYRTVTVHCTLEETKLKVNKNHSYNLIGKFKGYTVVLECA